MITYASLCSGVEGMGLGADWLGWEPIFQVEIDSYCQSVLQRNYPNIPKYKDVKTFNGKQYRNTVDVLFFGFPGQPYSTAGKREGDSDQRAIRKECIRIVQEVNPKFIVAENVLGIVSISNGMVFEDFCLEMENSGYEVQPINIPAAGIGACHKRQRIFFIAKNTNQYINGERKTGWYFGKYRHISSAVQVWYAPNCNSKWELQLQRMFSNEWRWFSNCNEKKSSYMCCKRPQGEDIKYIPKASSKFYRRTDITEQWHEVATRIHRMDDDLPEWLDVTRLRMDIKRMYPKASEEDIEKSIIGMLKKVRKERIKCCGNGVAAEVSYQICKSLETVMYD